MREKAGAGVSIGGGCAAAFECQYVIYKSNIALEVTKSYQRK